uniref:Obscurin n=1 Tax=Leptobrachium leishanense TaxID=445787 RepID=A0A8C5R414_9ANUR
MDYLSFTGAPRFLTRPKAFMMSVGKDSTLSCQIIGNPIPMVTWEKDKLPIKSGGRYKMVEDGNLYRLTIYDLNIGDSGQYICKAINTIGEAFAAVTIKVGDENESTYSQCSPFFILKPTNTRVNLGEDASFHCRVQGNPTPSINWEKDGRLLGTGSDSNRVRIETSGESSSLRIHCIRFSDSGTYICRAENRKHLLMAQPPPTAASLTPKGSYGVLTRTCTVTEGKHAKMSCYVTGEPKPEIVWKKDREVITEGRRHVVYEDEQENFVLKILFCKQIDNGLYTCTASNLAGQTYSSVLVIVKEPRVPFRSKLSDLEVREKETAMFQCEVPQAIIESSWYKEETQIHQSNKYNIEEEGAVRRLTIQNVTADDDAVYICEMKEGSRTIAELSVQGNIIKKLPRRTAVPITDTAIFCVELDNECQKIRWTNNGVEVTPGGRISITSSGKQHTMIIRDCQNGDSGEITFIADECRTSTKFTVSTHSHPPSIAPVNPTVTDKTDISLKLAWSPPPLDRPVPIDGYIVERKKLGAMSWVRCHETASVHASEFTVSHVPDEGSFQFRVSAVNSYGQSPYLEFPGTFYLEPIPSIKTPLKPVEITMGGEALFAIDLTTVSSGLWYLNGKMLQSNETYTIKRMKNTHTLTIRSVSQELDQAEVKFTSAGIENSAILRVKGKPAIAILGLLLFLIDYNSEFVSETSEENVKVSWYKNDKEIRQSRNFVLEVKGKHSHLLLPAKKDSGEYSCEALRGVTGQDREKTATLSCEVSQAKTEVKWYKDGKLITSSKKVKVVSEGQSRRLAVEQVEKKDGGEYSCEADKINFTLFYPKVQKDVQVILNEKATLSCEVSQTKTEVKWYKDGKLITSSKKIKVESDGKSRRLVVEQVEKKDGGEYICEAAGQKISFKINEKVQKEVQVIINETATMSCEVSQAKTEVKWYKDGKLITSSKKTKVESEGKSRRLVVEQVEKKDGGEYSCEAAGQKINFKINVKGENYPHGMICIVSPVALNETATLSCEVSQAKTEVKWYKDGKLITSSKKTKVESEGKSRRLVVEQVEKKDGGEYNCEATGQKINFKINVKEPEPAFANLEKVQKEVQVILNETATLSCEVSQAKTEVKWYKDGKLITSSKKTKVESDGKSRRLVVEQVEKKDGGEYSCEAPAFINQEKVQKEVQVILNEKATLSCEVSQAKTEVKWYKDEKLITSSKKTKVESEGKSRRLVVEQVEKNDGGEYICEAAGQKINFKISVKGECVILNETATLSCEVSQAKTEVKWYKDGKLITSSKKTKVESEEGASRTLVVKVAEAKDSGVYTCKTLSDKQEFKVQVKEIPQTFAKKLQAVTGETGSTVTLACELSLVKGDVLWRRNGVEIKAGKRFQICVEGTKRTLTISGLKADDEGEYSCESRNEKTISPRVVKFVGELNNVAVEEGGEATFKCTVSLEDAEVTWSINDIKVEKNEKYTIGKKGTSHTLTIARLTLQDTAEITAESEGVKTKANLKVREAPVLFKRKLEAVTVEERQTVQLVAELSKVSKDVKWMKNAILPPRDPSPAEALVMGQSHCQLCPLFQPFGPEASYSHYFFQQLTRALGTRASGPHFSRVRDTPGVKVAKGLHDVEVFEKDTATFELELSHDEVEGWWTKGGVKLKPSDTCKITVKGKKHMLSLLSVSQDNSGVIAFKSEGIQSSAKLIVKGKVCHEKCNRSVAGLVEKVTFECEVSRANAEVKWSKDGSLLRPSKKLTIISQGKKRSLTIHKCEYEDKGTYVCDAGDNQTSSSLSVNGKQLCIFRAFYFWRLWHYESITSFMTSLTYLCSCVCVGYHCYAVL